MLLALDVGNTNTAVGVFEDKELRVYWRLSTRREGTGDEYGMLISNLLHLAGLKPDQISALIIASVVPPLQSSLEEMAYRYFRIVPSSWISFPFRSPRGTECGSQCCTLGSH